MGVQLGDLRPFLDKIIAEIKSIRRNTESICCSAVTSAGLNSNIPAGYKSISITALSVPTTVTLSDGSTYTFTIVGETISQSSSERITLPAYSLSGGTWKWIGVK